MGAMDEGGREGKREEAKSTAPGGDGGGSKKGKPTGGLGLGGGGLGQWPGVDRTFFVLIGLIALLWALERVSSPAKEITFQDFRNNFLETGRVQRLTVNAERKTVAVHLKPEGSSGHIGGTHSDDLSTDMDAGVRSTSSTPSSSSSSSSSPSKREGKEGSSRSPSFYFAIGSVEAFERALDEAQKEMGLDPRDHVQVKYETEGTTLSTLFSLFQIGLFAFFAWQLVRGMSAMGGGGLGGGAGPLGGGRGGRNIFSIGKSPATLIKPGEMTKTTFNDVAGLDEAKVEVMEFVKFLKG